MLEYLASRDLLDGLDRVDFSSKTKIDPSLRIYIVDVVDSWLVILWSHDCPMYRHRTYPARPMETKQGDEVSIEIIHRTHPSRRRLKLKAKNDG